MATIYRAPEGFEAPALDYRGDWRAQERAYLDRLSAEARRVNGNDPLIGRVWRWQIADGYAVYIVWSVKPLALVHVELGDGYSIPAAHARGLRLTDVREDIARDDRLAAFFAERKAVEA